MFAVYFFIILCYNEMRKKEEMVFMEKILATKGKMLGIDFGDTRTGLAVSDPSTRW